jgi:hypothetical protein
MQVSAGDRSLEVEVRSRDTLEKLYELFDELGFTHTYSEERAEVEVSLHGHWLLFYLDRRVLQDEATLDLAFEDAERIAENYWRQ